VSYRTRISFVVQTEKPLTSDDRFALNEYASETIANSIESSEVQAVSEVTIHRHTKVKERT